MQAGVPDSTGNIRLIPPLWSKAIDLFNEKLTNDKKKKIDLKSCRQATFSDLLGSATIARDKAERKRYPWTANLQRILSQINRFAPVGDVLVQHHSEYTSLAWGAFRFLLLAAVEEGTTSAKLSEALESISQIIFRVEEYANLFSVHSGSSTERVFQSLQENMIHLYAEALNFLIRATTFFEKPAWRRYLSAGVSPFEAKFRRILDGIDRLERGVEKDITVLRSEAEIRREEYENGLWLQHADFTADLQKLQNQRVDGTCEWFLRSDRYKEWLQSSTSTNKSNLLWVQGKPGSGKSTLAGQIIHDLQLQADIIILFVFCKDGEDDKDNLESILRNLVFQLLESSPQRKSFHQTVQAARLSAKTSCVKSIAILWTLLQRMLEGNGQVYCIVDGLDECRNPVEERSTFLRQLTETFAPRGDETRLLVISRLGPSELGGDLRRWGYMQILSSDVQDDIEKFATTEVEKSPVLGMHRDKERILRVLIGCSDGMILWTALMTKELERGRWDVQRVLEKPPRGLSNIYSSILRRIEKVAESVEKIHLVLQLVLAAARPLRLEELALGLAVIEGLRSHEDYNLVGDPTAEGRAIVLSAQPLLIITPDETVEVTHSSLRDFLFDESTQLDMPAFRFRDDSVHRTVATGVLLYLSFECFADELSDEGREKCCFLEYASRWLVYHSSKSGESKGIVEKLVAFFNTQQGWRWLQRLSGAYGLSYGDLQLMSSQWRNWGQTLDLDRRSQDILSDPLLYLAQRRYEEMKLLLVDQSPALVLEAMDNLAWTYWNRGQWEKAEELDVQGVETRKRVLGVEHPETLLSVGNLASTYSHQGRWKEAEELEVQVMEARERVLGVEHPDTLLGMGNLASIYRGQGRFQEAEELGVQVMETRERVLGMEHPDTPASIANLASTYSCQGRWKEAEELGVQVMETRERVLGAEHPDTLTSMANLASIYSRQGRWREAEELRVQVVETRERVLVVGHPDTLLSMINLASTYNRQGRWREAEELQVQVTETGKRVLGKEHPDVLVSMGNLASTYWKQGRLREAEELGVQVMETRKRVLGVEHPGTLTSMAGLASTYWKQGRLREAGELGVQVVETRKRVLGTEHPDTLAGMAGLAPIYGEQGRLKEAEELEVKVMETRERVLGAEHPDTLASISGLAHIRKTQGQDEEAMGLMERAERLQKEQLGPSHPDTMRSTQTLHEWQRAAGGVTSDGDPKAE
ncbi:MAG: hypothetical protein M1840_009125 [Geoglossum simile]|nr:MAG: hypothetical protein M1840_009125 [Geoglossum simile]